MLEQMRCGLKLAAALVIGWGLYHALAPSPARDDVLFAVKAFVLNKFGTAEQCEGLMDEAGMARAEQNGTTKEYNAAEAFRKAVEAQRRLAAVDEKLAAYSIELAVRDRDNRAGRSNSEN